MIGTVPMIDVPKLATKLPEFERNLNDLSLTYNDMTKKAINEVSIDIVSGRTLVIDPKV